MYLCLTTIIMAPQCNWSTQLEIPTCPKKKITNKKDDWANRPKIEDTYAKQRKLINTTTIWKTKVAVSQ